jgi:hypothetical protein
MMPAEEAEDETTEPEEEEIAIKPVLVEEVTRQMLLHRQLQSLSREPRRT